MGIALAVTPGGRNLVRANAGTDASSIPKPHPHLTIALAPGMPAPSSSSGAVTESAPEDEPIPKAEQQLSPAQFQKQLSQLEGRLAQVGHFYPGLALPGGILAGLTAGGYANPFAAARITPGRVDMGVDFCGVGPIVAMASGVVTVSMTGGSGWPGGGFVEYRVAGGSLAGRYIYVAEGITPAVRAGDHVSAGQPVAQFVPGAPTCIETGFGAGVGTGTYAAVYGGGYTEGERTLAGLAFAKVLQSLGVSL